MTQTTKPIKCQTCNGAGTVYAHGGWSFELKACPECSYNRHVEAYRQFQTHGRVISL